MDSSHGESMEEGMEPIKEDTHSRGLLANPLAAFHPTVGMISLKPTSMIVQPLESEKSQKVDNQ